MAREVLIDPRVSKALAGKLQRRMRDEVEVRLRDLRFVKEDLAKARSAAVERARLNDTAGAYGQILVAAERALEALGELTESLAQDGICP